MTKNLADTACYLTIVDNNYVPHLLAMLASLARVEDEIPFFVAHLDLTQENQNLIKDYAGSIGLKLNILLVDDLDLSVYQPCGNYPLVGWLKFHIDHFLPKQYLQILFIDPDTIVLQPLKPVFEIDMNGMPIASVIDKEDENPTLKKELGIDLQDHYYNSGVMLIDRAAFNKKKIGEISSAFAIKNPDKITFLDQCAFNAACAGKMKELDKKWNLMIGIFEGDPQQTRLVHYCAIKPWKEGGTPGIELYAHFRNKTPLPFRPSLKLRRDYLYFRIRDRLGLKLLYYRLPWKNKKFPNENMQRNNRMKFRAYLKRHVA